MKRKSSGTPKAAQPKAAKPKRAARATPAPETAKITLLVKENPSRKGTKAHQRFELFKNGMTVSAFLKAGGRRSTLRRCIRKGYVKVAA